MWVLFAATIIVVVIAIEAGHRLGDAVHRRSEDEKEPPVSAKMAAILGLLAFILVFAFGIVYDRYDNRRELVRNEANAIGTAYLRSDFMSEPDRSKTRKLFREYLDTRIAAAKSRNFDQTQKVLTESNRIQHQLWDMAVVNAFKDMNSDVAALYIDSLNQVIDIHALRVAVGLQARIPAGIWLVLYILVFLGMFGVGYQTAIAGSARRSWATPILAFTFSLVIVLIASLDRPQSGFITVSQQPLVDLRASMDTVENNTI
jgi:hypothetical protein